MTPDPALDAIRRARHQISDDVDHDAARLIDRYRQMQATFTGRIIPGPESTPEQPSVSPDNTASVRNGSSTG